MSAIIEVNAREILESRGNPTIEVEVLTERVTMARRRFRPALPPANMKPSNARRRQCSLHGKGT
jgi:enolase